MLDDNRDKDQARNQIIAIVLMTVLVVGWSYFLLPSPNKTPEPGPLDTTVVIEENAEAAPLAETELAAGTEPLAETEPAAGAEPLAETEPPPDATATETPAPLDPPREQATPESPALDPLPPVAEADPAQDEVRLTGSQLELVFTRIGGRLKEATVLLNEDGTDTRQLIPDWGETPDAEAVYPFGLRFSNDLFGDELDARRWEATVEEGASVRFEIEVPGAAHIVKTFRLAEESMVLDLDVEYTNLGKGLQVLGKDNVEPAFSVNWGPNVNSGDADKYMKQEFMFHHGDQDTHLLTSKLELPPLGVPYNESVRNLSWVAVRSAYFAIALKPQFEGATGWVWGVPEHFRMGVAAPRTELAGGAAQSWQFRAYLGPRVGNRLEAAWPGLDSLLDIFTVWGFTPVASFMNWFARTLLNLMNWFYSIIPNYGVAIILLTLIIRLGMLPLTLKSMKSMKQMQKLAPEMERLKEELGDDQQEVQRRMMELYKERGVNPLGGCMPLFLQMPVFIAFYRMLSYAYELRGAPFVGWMQDLSEPDRFIELPFAIPLPFAGELDALNLLPILMGVAMLVSQKLTPMAATSASQNQQQKIIMTVMPIFFSVICYNMASSLNLYIFVSTMLGIVQTYVTRKVDIDVDVTPKKKKKSKPSHFYNAAQVRKKEMAKEARREKRTKQTRRGDKQPKTTGKKRP